MAEECLTLTVLVVEDGEDCAQSTAELLILAGHVVRVARCGKDALREAAAETPDVVLMDIGLPDLDGWAVTKLLRAQATGKQPLVFAVTGREADADRWRSADAGFDLHLVKPVTPHCLVNLLDRVRSLRCDCRARSGDSKAPT